MQQLQWKNATEFQLKDVTFVCAAHDFSLRTNEDQLVLLKTKTDLAHYETVFRDVQLQNVLEFGIFQGGSPALFTLWFELEKFVGIDRSAPVASFDAFCERHRLGETVRSYYETSQTDQQAVESIISNEFANSTIDLVIDDASHHYRRTKRTFEIAFPHLRPGGYYVIEDWGWAHWPHSRFYIGETALSMLVMELAMLCAARSDIIEEIRVFPSFVFVRKGQQAPALMDMKLDTLYSKRGLGLMGTRDLRITDTARLLWERLKGRQRS